MVEKEEGEKEEGKKEEGEKEEGEKEEGEKEEGEKRREEKRKKMTMYNMSLGVVMYLLFALQLRVCSSRQVCLQKLISPQQSLANLGCHFQVLLPLSEREGEREGVKGEIEGREGVKG